MQRRRGGEILFNMEVAEFHSRTLIALHNWFVNKLVRKLVLFLNVLFCVAGTVVAGTAAAATSLPRPRAAAAAQPAASPASAATAAEVSSSGEETHAAEAYAYAAAAAAAARG